MGGPDSNNPPHWVVEILASPHGLPNGWVGIQKPNPWGPTEQSNYRIKACETLRRHPHPNIAQYYGCQVSNGRVIGLCFKAYQKTLMEEANPGHLNKRSSNHHLPNDIATRYLLGIDRGLRHMHSLGLVHNDVNPSNVMLSDEAIIIDFDSCLPVGSLLATAKRTPEWHDSRVWISTPGNDHRALQEMKI